MTKLDRSALLLATVFALVAGVSCGEESGTNADLDSDSNGSDLDTDSDSDTDSDGDSDGDTDSDSDSDGDTDTDSDGDADGDSDGDADGGADGGSDADSDSDSDSDTICVDLDSDWWCEGEGLDCVDTDSSIYPGAPEIEDGIDNDCDGETDEPSWMDIDNDGDGFSFSDGDCVDFGEGSEFINPDAIEDLGDGSGDGIDNDCDGLTDEIETCDCPSVGVTAWDFVDTLGLCNHHFVDDVELNYTSPSGNLGYDTLPSQGSNDCLLAQEGCEMAAISSGPVGEANPNSAVSMGGTASTSLDPQPAYQGTNPTTSTIYTSCDRSQIRLELTAPSNALGFSFDFLFGSAEYPEWIGDGFNDAFYAIMEYSALNGGATTNISFDDSDSEIEVDTNFFENSSHPCNESGSGWEPAVSGGSGSTGWLRTTWNVDPGDSFVITFSIHDEGDCIYDSIAFIDNWKWATEPVEIGTTPID